MIVINRGNLYEASGSAWGGWLDTETGGIRYVEFIPVKEGGGARIPKDVLDQPARYVRVPGYSSTRLMADFLYAKNMERKLADEYGIELKKHRDDEYVIHVDHDVIDIPDGDREYTERLFSLITHEFDWEEEYYSFGDEIIFKMLERWCRENGYELYGGWEDWDDFDMRRRFWRGEP